MEEKFLSHQYVNHNAAQLRQANRYHANLFLEELLPKYHGQIIQQIDNLRSNNSKEALTLAGEIFQHQSIEKVDRAILSPLISILFTKTVC